MKRWQKAVLVAAAAAVPVMSCGQRSLVLLDVRSSSAFTNQSVLLDVRLSVTANDDVTTRYPRVHLQPNPPYRIGMYLPSEMNGRVTFVASVDNGDCVVGTGTAIVNGVQSGETSQAIDLVIEPAGPCTSGSGGTGVAGTSGAAGMTGAGGNAGAAGTGPGGNGGVGGSGGMTGVGGTNAGTAGVIGTAGAAGSGRGGAAGTAGAAGTNGGVGGRGGAAGTGPGGLGGVATAGTGGVGGTIAGVGGVTGSGGLAGVGGRGGAAGSAGVGGTVGGSGPGVGGTVGGSGPGGVGGSGPGGVGGSFGGSSGGAGGSFGGSGPGAAGGSFGGSGPGGSGAGGTTGCSASTCQPPFICTSGGQCVCSESAAQACARAGVACGYINDNCGQQVFCSCPLATQFCNTATYTCFSSCTTGAGGTITTDIICPTTPD